MPISDRSRNEFEVAVAATISNTWKTQDKAARSNRAARWPTAERKALKTVGPILIDVQRNSAINVLRRIKNKNSLAKLGFTGEGIQMAGAKLQQALAEWRAGQFDGNGRQVVEIMAEVNRTTQARWENFRQNVGKRPTQEQRDHWADVNYGRHRAEMIAVTEVTRAASAGERIAMTWLSRHLRLRTERIWITRRDEFVCPICGPLHNQPEVIWREVAPKGTPAHPRCRCKTEPEVQPLDA